MWTGPIQRKGAGNYQQDIVRLSRTLLAQMDRLRKIGNIQFMRRVYRLPDGDFLDLILDGEKRVARLLDGYAIRDERYQLTLQRINGLAEGRTDYDTMQAEGAFRAAQVLNTEDFTVSPWRNVPQLLGSLGDWPTWYYPVEPGNPLCSPTQDGCRLETPCVSIPRTAMNPPRIQYSGMFTGEMAKCAQILYGWGQHVPYRYCWVRTHGLWIASNGDRWVIEISADDGVTAWKLDVWPLADLLGTGGLPYEPKPIPQLPFLADRKVLLDAAGMSAFYDPDQNPFFPECGWSFNDSGDTAINTSWDFYSEGGQATDVQSKRSSVWTLTITGGDEPESASLVQDGPYFLFNETHTRDCAKFPTYGPAGVCFESMFVSFEQEVPPNYDQAPVYAYFEGNNRVEWWMRVTPTDTSFEDGRPPGNQYGCLQGNGLWAPFSGSGGYSYGNTTTSGVVWFEKRGGSTGLPTPQAANSEQAVDYSYSWEQQPGWIAATESYNGILGIWSEHWRLSETMVEHQFSQPARWEQLLIPAHSRNSAFHMQVLADSGGNSVHRTVTTTTCLAQAKGQYYDNWQGGPASYRPYPPYDETNPCDCEIGTTTKFIGRWSMMGLQGSLTDDYVSASGGQLLQGPQLDPYRGDGRYLFCYDQGRDGNTSDGCTYVSSCTCILDQRIDVLVPETNGYVKMNYHDPEGVIHNVIDDVYDFDKYDPYWRFIETPGTQGCQILDAHLDAFSLAGSVATDIVDPFAHTTRLHFKDADNFYYMDELNLIERTWFGRPFPWL